MLSAHQCAAHQCALYFFPFLLAKNVRWVTFPWLTIAFPGDTQWSFQISKSVPFLEPLSLSLCRFFSLSSCICVHIYCLKDAIFGLHTSLLLHESRYTSINTYMQYITLHYITLHYIALHCIALHCIALHYITLHYITWRDVTLRCSYSYSCSSSCSYSYSYSYSCRQCVALHVHIPNPDIIPKCRSGRWFPISMNIHDSTSFLHRFPTFFLRSLLQVLGTSMSRAVFHHFGVGLW